MRWSVRPEPADASERAALLDAVERALAEEGAGSELARSRWWRAGLDDLRDGAAPEEPRRDSRVVEP